MEATVFRHVQVDVAVVWTLAKPVPTSIFAVFVSQLSWKDLEHVFWKMKPLTVGVATREVVVAPSWLWVLFHLLLVRGVEKVPNCLR